LKRKQSRSNSERREDRKPRESHEPRELHDPSTRDIAPQRTRAGAAHSNDRTRSFVPDRSELATWRSGLATWCSERTTWILPLILVLAFVLRLAYVLQSRASPYFAEPQMDAAYHVEWARALAAGRAFQPGPFFRAPLYPWFLASSFVLFGESYLAPRILQAGIGTLGVLLVYLVATRVFDRRVGWLAALFAATYWVLIYFDGELLLPVLEVPLDLLAIWLSLRVADRPDPARAALGGAAWGVAALVRPNVLLFVPLVGLWILWSARKTAARESSGVKATLAFVLGLAGPILPISAYNTFIGGDAVLISSQGGVNLWIGNNPQSDGSSAIVPGTRADWWGGYFDAIHQAEAASGRTLKPSEVSSWYTHKAIDFVLREPARALRLMLWKLRLFWTDWELGNNSDERFFAFRFGPILRWLPLGFGVLAPLALVGFLWSWKRARRDLPLWGFLPVYMASVVAFFVCSRFRVPILPVLCMFAAYACTVSVDLFRRKRFAALAGILVAFALASWAVRDVPREIDQSDSSGLWLLGVHEVQHGRLDSAENLFREAIAAKPRNMYALRDLGLLLKDSGKYADAEASLRAALQVRADDPTTWRGLVDLELKQARFAEANESARRAIAIAPYSARAEFDLGWVAAVESHELARHGAPADEVRARREEALQAFRAASALHPPPEEVFDDELAAGRVLVSLGRWHEAVDALTRALRSRTEPDAEGEFWSCAQLLLQALIQDGRAGEAQAQLAALAARFPFDPRAAALQQQFGR
jgi:tetratricopeptide (TPR) repeat protein